MQASDVFFLTNDNKTLSSVYEQNCPAKALVPQGVQKIDRRAFADCPVNSVELPDSVTELCYEAFAGCDALQSIKFPKHIETVEAGVFRGCLSLEKIEMGDSIKSLSESMFESCASLEDFPFRNGILELPRNVFSECVSLKSVALPKSVAAIRSGAFAYCQSLETVVLPEGLKLIEDDAFRNCKSLSHIRFAGDNPAFFVDDDGCLFARRDDGSLVLIKVPAIAREITIPQTVVQSHSEAFYGCDALKTLYIDCPLVEHPIFVALKTEVVADIVDTSSEEYQAELAQKEKSEAEAVCEEEIFDEENGGIEESILDDVEAEEEPASAKADALDGDAETAGGEAVEGADEAKTDQEAAPVQDGLQGQEASDEGASQSSAASDLLADIMGQSGAVPEAPAESEAAQEGNGGDFSESEVSAAAGDDLLADILGQNTGAGDDDEDDEMKGVRITPEELDEAVMRGIQEESEEEFAARIKDAQAHSHDGENGEGQEEPQAAEPQEPRFVYGMESMSEAFEIVDERALYPDRPEEALDKHEPNEMEDITTLVVVTEKVTEEKTISPALKNFCVELARSFELKRVYFFGGLGLDNDEFLFGFGKFAMYRNVIYAALADSQAALSKEIANFGDIAELASPVEPFQNAAAPNALELEKPFKIYVQDSLSPSAAVSQAAAAPADESAAEESAVAEQDAPEIMDEAPGVEESAQGEQAPAQRGSVTGEGFLARALRILAN